MQAQRYKDGMQALLPGLFLFLGSTWLLAPALNPALSNKISLISQFEAPGQQWAWFFKLCDVLAGVVLIVAASLLLKKEESRVWRAVFWLLIIFGACMIIDVIAPIQCGAVIAKECTELREASWWVHAIESVASNIVILAVLVLTAIKKDRFSQIVLAMLLILNSYAVAILVFGLNNSTLLQVISELLIVIWITHFLWLRLSPEYYKPSFSPYITTKVISFWVGINGLVSLFTPQLIHLNISGRLGNLYFADTGLMAQNSVLVGLVLLYLTRQLWRGEHRAWQFASLLLWVQVLKYSVIAPEPRLVILYFFAASLLLFEERNFTRYSRFKFADAMKAMLLPVLALLFVTMSAVALVYVKSPDNWQDVTSVGATLLRQTAGIDSGKDGEKSVEGLMSQVERAAVGTIALLFLASFFTASRSRKTAGSIADRHRAKSLLAKFSSSSEDYFKIWPEDKEFYWHGEDAFIAYKVSGPVAFALAEVVGDTPGQRHKALEEFIIYCRGKGWRVCFLGANEKTVKFYESFGCKSVNIGASALIDIQEFCDKTLKGKWWRWIMNRAKREGWEYVSEAAPHSANTIEELMDVSDSWLTRQGHVERTFALGYFDKSYINKCTLHMLKKDGRIIAFANELPTFKKGQTASIDMMRFLSGYDGVVAALLGNTISGLKNKGKFRNFDLGFVPLASPKGRFSKAISDVGRYIIGERVSSKGLEQFKNKFNPDWQPYYLVFDGDWVDFVRIAAEIDNVMSLD